MRLHFRLAIYSFVNLCSRETPEPLLLQTVETLMKFSIMLNFIRVYTVKVKKGFQTKEYNFFLKIIT